LSESRMREIRTSWFDERGVETERQSPRHSSTLHFLISGRIVFP
jgi:hypothetical protein